MRKAKKLKAFELHNCIYNDVNIDIYLWFSGSNEPQEGFSNAYFDLERVPGTNSMSIDTSSFELDSMNFEDGQSAMAAQTDKASKSQIVSEPLSSTKLSPVPIRKVLDIFQELRLSFGRDQWFIHSSCCWYNFMPIYAICFLW